jgi:acetate kinase
MTVLTVNVGSSSVRLAAYDDAGRGVAEAHHAGHELNAAPLLGEFARQPGLAPISAVAHRVVHGGDKLRSSVRISADVEAQIDRLSELAPLHNPPALRWIRACREQFGPAVPQVAVFDTAFFAELPQVARTYGLPRELSERLGLRRYGFHGLAHRYLWQRWQSSHLPPRRGRAISLQLGSGCSVAAVRDGLPLDTSMGFSPLEGLMMATRAGDLDPGLLLYLQRKEGYSAERLEALLSQDSGLLGVSAQSADMRELLATDAPAAALAIDIFCYRARKYIGAYLAVLGGADAILFGGGVGEHLPVIRARILNGLEWAGIGVDRALNAAAVGREARIEVAGSPVEIAVIPVDESAVLAAEARTVLGLH